jgi:hypothetical protein
MVWLEVFAGDDGRLVHLIILLIARRDLCNIIFSGRAEPVGARAGEDWHGTFMACHHNGMTG